MLYWVGSPVGETKFRRLKGYKESSGYVVISRFSLGSFQISGHGERERLAHLLRAVLQVAQFRRTTHSRGSTVPTEHQRSIKEMEQCLS